MARFASVKIRERGKIKAPTLHSILHNSRIGKEATYLLPKEFRRSNYHAAKISNATKTWENWVAVIEDRYRNAHNRKLRSDAVRIEEGLIVLSDEQVRNCDPDQIWQKMQEFARWFEERHNTEVLSLDWHRDEGEIVNGEPTYNEHAHFLFADVDRSGNKVRSNWQRSGEELREMQDKIAELFAPLGFERGIANQQKEYRRPREQRQYRQKQKKEKIVKRAAKLIKSQIDTAHAKIKDLNEENKRLRAALKEAGAKREQYAELESLVRDLRSRIKTRDLTIEELRRTFADKEEGLKSQIESLRTQNEQLLDQNRALAQANEVKTPQIANLEHLDEKAIKRIKDSVETELIAAALKQDSSAGRVINGVVCAANQYEIEAHTGVFDANPISRREDDLDIAAKAFPDKDFHAVSFATHVFIRTARENILDALRATSEMIDRFAEKLKQVRAEIEEDQEQQIEESYDYTQDRNIGGPTPW
ncbi:MAG TPA: hypothetical protein EYN66_15810 [Myxococcales bacterium]|nr:hypothetical protein [Myxococcales bacterium]